MSWLPYFFSLGILTYFSFSREPDVYVTGLASLVICGALIFLRKRGRFLKLWMCVCFYFLGFCVTQLHTYAINHQALEKEIPEMLITGDVFDIQHMEGKRRLVIRNIQEVLPINDGRGKTSNWSSALDHSREESVEDVRRLKGIRINVKEELFHDQHIDHERLSIGDTVSIPSRLFPLPHILVPNGFDFRRYAYFKGIGAVGYATGAPTILARYEKQFIDRVFDFPNMRNTIIEKMKLHLKQPATGIATGILVGDVGLVPKDTIEVVRDAGIAHLLAISGMHMIVLVGILFFTARYCVLKIEYIALRIDSKKIAAIVALLGSAFYLKLSLSPISAQRAFIMSSIALIAIILGRESSAVRAMSISAILILLMAPQELLNPSLQMSFAASFALIVSLSKLSTLFLTSIQIVKASRMSKLLAYFGTICLASIIASLATAPFVIYHFHNVSVYGALTNLVAIPINDFWIMPWGIVSLLLMPFGYEKFPVVAMGTGVDLIYMVAKYVSNIPYASLAIAPPSGLGLVLTAYGMFGYFIAASNIRYLFLMLMLCGPFLKSPYDRPDILIEPSSKLFAIRDNDGLIISSNKKSKYVLDVWSEAYGNNVRLLNDMNISGCNADACMYGRDGQNVLIIGNKNVKLVNCHNIGLLINLTSSSVYCNNVKKINNTILKSGGAHFIKINGGKINVTNSMNIGGKRIWNRLYSRKDGDMGY
ncbi:ComEC/Rec2 family competence protein [Rickettsiales endosymbiont of Peranema trichophorum]|uniref:ComEC/Rec2 family competence protein n=1 Tax=Rickettsiales endosymbiont of Peranema trichophorum TaxID=2486577 RepID=UPI002413DEB4|nr:ComEC/Rec2 family competence protein [Rickettsiales endosymbiont of Peranema trichophorum]